MKIKTILPLIGFSLGISTSVMAQGQCNQYFQLDKGVSWTTEIKGSVTDKKGKIREFNLKKSFEVDKVKEEDGITIFELTVGTYGPKGNRVMLTSKDELYCKDGDYLVSVLAYMTSPYEHGEKKSADLALRGIIIPSDLDSVTEFEDISTEFEYKVYQPRVQKNQMKLEITDRKVEGKEEITTPLGTFTAYKISSIVYVENIEASPNPAGPQKIIEYIVPKYGIVRKEIYTMEGVLYSTEEITEFKVGK
jgi:hypothetical protein